MRDHNAESPAPDRQSLPLEGYLEQILTSASVPVDRLWRPVILKLDAGEYDALAAACERWGIHRIDEYERQLADLAAVRLPGGTPDQRAAFVRDYVEQDGGLAESGNWILLPWERKLVHLLDEEAYFEVITNRNHDKVTRREQQVLRSKKVGVMGLSLGGEAAVAVAREHLCGHLVVADFDRLDLSNLNRIDGGFDDLGLPKTTIAARRIVKLDPYLRLTVFEEGVTEETIDAFLDGLDLLIEECDGLRVKYDVRAAARDRGLNIVFAGDERGFLSVEPYGQVPDLPPFHGRITEPQPPREEFATPRGFLEELTEWLGGWDAISARTRASLERVGTELCGYPQLASEARFAAGQVGHVARRLLLGERVKPYVGWVDLDELVPTTKSRDAGAAPGDAGFRG